MTSSSDARFQPQAGPAADSQRTASDPLQTRSPPNSGRRKPLHRTQREQGAGDRCSASVCGQLALCVGGMLKCSAKLINDDHNVFPVMTVIEREFFNLGVIKASLNQVTTAFANLFHPVLARPTALSFPVQRYHAEPGDPPLMLWTPCSSPDLTAFMPHVSSGDYFVASYASERFKLSLAHVRSTARGSAEPINEFVAYPDGSGVGPSSRMVRAFKDDPRWDFCATGEPLPFEDERAYTARFVRDRFTRPMLLDHLESWGAPVRNQAFWESDEQAVTLVRTRHGS